MEGTGVSPPCWVFECRPLYAWTKSSLRCPLFPFLPSPSSIPPSLLQVLWAPLGSHPSLSHTGPIIVAAHKLVGLQMWRACRTYMVSVAWTKTCESERKNTRSFGCGQDVFSTFVKQEGQVWESSCARCVGWLKIKEVLELVWSLGI